MSKQKTPPPAQEQDPHAGDKSPNSPAHQQGDNASGANQRNKNATANNTAREGGSTGTG